MPDAEFSDFNIQEKLTPEELQTKLNEDIKFRQLKEEVAALKQKEKAVKLDISAQKQVLLDRIESDFSYHAPKGDQVERYETIRNLALKLARIMVEYCPASRELSTALTSLETAVMHANASIARNE